MRLIDADALMAQLGIAHECVNCSDKMQAFCDAHPDFGSTCELVCEAPTVDAVKVVRCGKCKYRDTVIQYCGMVDLIRRNDDWYCADGERKEVSGDDNNT